MNNSIKISIVALTLVFSWNQAKADRVCPKGKSYKIDLCWEIVDKPNGTQEMYPVGKSYKRDETWVRTGNTIAPKGKSYKWNKSYEVSK